VNTWKVILATMVIFGTGVVTGGLLVRHSELHRFRPPRVAGLPRPAQPSSPGGSRIELLRRVGRELNLTPEQRERVDKIISASQERAKKIMEPVTPKMREEVQRTKDELREVLTPEQRMRFDELLKQQRPHEQHRPVPPRERPVEGAPVPATPSEPSRNP